MSFIRRLVGICGVVLLASTVSGCVIRPLWWGDHERRDHEQYRHYSGPAQDGGRGEVWRQAR